VNQLARDIVNLATDGLELDTLDAKRAAASLLGRLGGLKGGVARAKSLSKRRRTEIARSAANKRWERSRGEES
jgi:hypothetical protein